MLEKKHLIFLFENQLSNSFYKEVLISIERINQLTINLFNSYL